MTHIRINGVELECADEGKGVPVVFSHGGGSDMRYWEPQRKAFAAHHRFVTYSRRFHGSGPWPVEADDSTDAHVSDLVAIMDRLGGGPVHLVGFSTAIALHATLAMPELVRSLTIVEPNVPSLLAGDPEGEAVLEWWRRENARVQAEAAGGPTRRAALWFELVNNRGAGTFETQPEWFRRMWLDNFNARRPRTTAPSVTCEHLAAIATPTLAIGSEHGMPYSRRILDALGRCIPHCRLVILPLATHFMSYQAPEAFNETILNFIAAY
jgi:pimeloyl-ACP methyl ester carboxylesterase